MKISQSQILKLFLYVNDIKEFPGIPLRIREKIFKLIEEIIEQQNNDMIFINENSIKNEQYLNKKNNRSNS